MIQFMTGGIMVVKLVFGSKTESMLFVYSKQVFFNGLMMQFNLFTKEEKKNKK